MRRKNAFTLIELLVVVAIIAVLIALLLPSLTMSREMARSTVCSSQLRHMGSAVYIYAQENTDSFPTFRLTYNPYGWDDWRKQIAMAEAVSSRVTCPDNYPDYYHCPSHPEIKTPSNYAYWMSYGCNCHIGLSDSSGYYVAKMTQVNDPTKTVMLFDYIPCGNGGWHGINVWSPQQYLLAFRHINEIKVNFVLCDGHTDSQKGFFRGDQLLPKAN
jgi:prepilin-type N-terminal cleavage/methylation domain-containing protein